MKPKKLSKKLVLNKESIADLNGYAMKELIGGASECTCDTWGCCETRLIDTCTCEPQPTDYGKGCPTYTCFSWCPGDPC